ncbi:MAG: ATP-binding protein [Clostridia bacterium]|nr:ATP-binding protein [Clostridia bacterium]
MESAYTFANRKLAKIREDNRAEQERRLIEVRNAYPEYRTIEEKLIQGGTALARCVLNGGKDYEKIKEAICKLQDRKKEILKQLNLPEDYLDEIYSCDNCRDTGYDADGRRCGCLRQLVLSCVGESANLTEYMKEQTFDKVDYNLFAKQPPENGRQPLLYMKSAYEKGLRFAENFDTTNSNLLLMGNAGTGKTFLSSCIANYALARGKTVLYQSAFKMFDTLEKLKFDKLDSDDTFWAQDLSRQIYQTDLLIIDDLGTEFVTGYSAAALFDIINSRQMRKKSTILSTNLNLSGLEQLYSKRFTSRICGDFEIIPFIGQDLRMNRNKIEQE